MLFHAFFAIRLLICWNPITMQPTTAQNSAWNGFLNPKFGHMLHISEITLQSGLTNNAVLQYRLRYITAPV
jgi:hypothetical protein